MIERLDLRLPRFCRELWVSLDARAYWQPRLSGLAARLDTLATRPRLVDPAPAELASLRARADERGLVTLRLPDRPDVAPQLDNPTLIATAPVAEQIARAWHRGDVEAVLAGLDLPACCARAFIRTHVEQRWRDGAWITLADAPETVAGPVVLNRMLARIGLAAIDHDPCSPECPASLALAEQQLDVLRTHDRAAVDELLAILDWPIEWSALHGAVELRTPVVKLCWDSDATAGSVVRRRDGSSWPEHAAVGQRFPYRPPERHRLLASIGWRRGLDHAQGSS